MNPEIRYDLINQTLSTLKFLQNEKEKKKRKANRSYFVVQATRVPDNYTAPAVFTKALGHSKQELSWDKADPKRSALLNTDFSRKQLKDMNYETFVNVINDDEESDESDVGEDVADQEADGEAGEHEAEGAESAEENGHKQNGSGGEVKKENGKENGSTKIKESTVKESDKTVKKKVDPEERKRMKVERTRNKYMGLLTGMLTSISIFFISYICHFFLVFLSLFETTRINIHILISSYRTVRQAARERGTQNLVRLQL